MSQAGTVPKRLSTTSWKQCRTIAQRLYISDAKEFGEIPMPSPRTGVPKTGELDQNRPRVGQNDFFGQSGNFSARKIARLLRIFRAKLIQPP